jgi:aspartate-semialdehyde dehydrogenase
MSNSTNNKKNRAPKIGIVGATGVVGTEALQILASRDHPIDSLVVFGSSRSAGSRVVYGDALLEVFHVDEVGRHALEYALLCAGAEAAIHIRDLLKDQKVRIIDNSSAFRSDPDIPLVIPEVNADLLGRSTVVVANPNCSTIMLLTAIEPLRAKIGIESIIVTTYQAVSGAGKSGIDELYQHTRGYLQDQPTDPNVFPISCAFNVFEHESDIDPITGFNGEELKIINETQKIYEDSTCSVLPTCVRVPVERAHSQSVILELSQSVDLEMLRDIYAGFEGVVFDPSRVLTPRDVAGKDEVHIGRARIDPDSDGTRLVLWVCCDQIRKGAALNAIQIMDALLELDALIELDAARSPSSKPEQSYAISHTI